MGACRSRAQGGALDEAGGGQLKLLAQGVRGEIDVDGAAGLQGGADLGGPVGGVAGAQGDVGAAAFDKLVVAQDGGGFPAGVDDGVGGEGTESLLALIARPGV